MAVIIGNGDIASALREGGVDRDDLLFFAAGVSNSGEMRKSEYQREKDLLLAQDRDDWLIYFSSLCIFYSDSHYADHKFEIERRVKEEFRHYTILRLGNIIWGDNPHTLINYLRAHPDAPLQDTYRYILDKEEFWHWLRLIPDFSCEMNIPGRRMLVKDIYQEFVVQCRQPA